MVADAAGRGAPPVASDEAGDGLEAAEAADPTNRVLMGSADRALLLVLTKLLDEAGVLRDLWEGVGAPLPSGLAPQATLQAAASQAHTAAEPGPRPPGARRGRPGAPARRRGGPAPARAGCKAFKRGRALRTALIADASQQ